MEELHLHLVGAWTTIWATSRVTTSHDNSRADIQTGPRDGIGHTQQARVAVVGVGQNAVYLSIKAVVGGPWSEECKLGGDHVPGMHDVKRRYSGLGSPEWL